MKKRAIGETLLVFSAPALTVFLMHQAFRSTFGRNNFVLGIYSRDVYVPLAVGFFMALWIAHSRNPLPIRLRKRTAGLHGATLAACLGYLQAYDFFSRSLGALGATVFLAALVLLVGILPFFLFLSPKDYWSRLQPLGARLLYPAAAGLLLVAYPYILELAWRPIVKVTAPLLIQVLAGLGYAFTEVACAVSVVIRHKAITASIGMGCSGLEGVFFFLFAFSLYRFFSPQRGNVWGSIAACAIGIPYMLVVNLIRILIFLVFAIWLNDHSTNRAGTDFFVWAFHSNIGWLLYLAAILLYFQVIRRMPRSAWQR